MTEEVMEVEVWGSELRRKRTGWVALLWREIDCTTRKQEGGWLGALSVRKD